jgi:Hint domain
MPDVAPAKPADPAVSFLSDGAAPVRSTPCFTPGTMVTTQRGECPVEHLTVGDRVITRDNGMQPVRWIGKTQMFLYDFQADPHLLPVFIRQGALGKGLPERDMMLSPNHRVLVANERTALRFREREVLVAAKHLTTHGVHTVQSSGTTYIHFMCDRHEIVLADGIWTESFQPEDHSLKGIGNAQRLEIYEIFPDLKTAAGRAAYGAARPTATGSEMTEGAAQTAGV